MKIGYKGTSTKPPFSKIEVWRPSEREPRKYHDVKVDRNDVIVEDKF